MATPARVRSAVTPHSSEIGESERRLREVVPEGLGAQILQGLLTGVGGSEGAAGQDDHVRFHCATCSVDTGRALPEIWAALRPPAAVIQASMMLLVPSTTTG